MIFMSTVCANNLALETTVTKNIQYLVSQPKMTIAEVLPKLFYRHFSWWLLLYFSCRYNLLLYTNYLYIFAYLPTCFCYQDMCEAMTDYFILSWWESLNKNEVRMKFWIVFISQVLIIKRIINYFKTYYLKFQFWVWLSYRKKNRF